jgi:hypothetical protein
MAGKLQTHLEATSASQQIYFLQGELALREGKQHAGTSVQAASCTQLDPLHHLKGCRSACA